jgi:integrase/recombinase XerC
MNAPRAAYKQCRTLTIPCLERAKPSTETDAPMAWGSSVGSGATMRREHSAAITEFRKECGRRGHQPGSIDKRISLLSRTEHALQHDLLDATTIELRTFLDGKKIHARTRYCYISHLATFWRWAVIEGMAETDPTLRLTRPKMRVGLPRPIATNDLLMLIEAAPNHAVAAMLYLAGHAGLRCMEIAGLDAAAVMDHQTPPVLIVEHGKGDKQRVIPLGPQLIEALHAHGIPRYGPVFRRPNGDRFAPWGISHILREHLHRCQVNASAHQLRHTFATEVYRRSGGDLRMTQELLGHSSPSTTAIYTAWSQDRAAVVVAGLYGGDAA